MIFSSNFSQNGRRHCLKSFPIMLGFKLTTCLIFDTQNTPKFFSDTGLILILYK